MKVSFKSIDFKSQKSGKNNKQNSDKNVVQTPAQKALTKAKTGAIVGLFLLPTLGIVKHCSTDNDPNKIVIVDEPVDTTNRAKYVKTTPASMYVIKSGDSPARIAKEHGVSTRRLLALNDMDSKSVIYPNDTILIPESYEAINIKNLKDIVKMSGISKEYLETLIEFEQLHNTIYKDRNGNETIGVGHLVKPEERALYRGRTLSDEEVYTLLAQDILDIEADLKTVINKDAYDNMPAHLKESVFDLAFNKGVGAISDNEKLLSALNNEDYVNAVADLTQDYSVVTNAKGEKVHRPAAGLSKRRIYNIANASEIFKNGMPDVVADSAQAVYQRGLTYLEAEKNKGDISADAYENVVKEYQALAHEWTDGRIGKEGNAQTAKSKSKVQTAKSKAQSTAPSAATVNDKRVIYVNGKKTNWTVSTLYADWEKTAKRQLRYVKRPLPEIDKNGNITAYVKTFAPSGKGKLSGKTIIINPGHGGAMNYIDKNGKVNVNFDPGTSNAVMSKKNPNVETNKFIGNGGKSLEEWVVNQRIADELVKKINKEGGKVIYVQGSVYSAMDAIRKIQKQNKIDMIVSLHSNSSGGKRGIHVYANNRGGIDEKDKALAEAIVNKLNQHSWFRGITEQKSKSLGVLSASRYATSPVPGVLIETGDLKHKSDVANLNSRDFKNLLIDGIFESIKNYRN